MGSIVFPAARALVAWLEQHGGNLQGVRALGMICYVLNGFGHEFLCFNGSGYDLCFYSSGYDVVGDHVYDLPCVDDSQEFD